MTERNEQQDQLRARLEETADPLAYVLLAAQLASLGDPQPWRDWPRRLGPTDAASLEGAIRAATMELIPGLRSAAGEELAGLVLQAQAFATLRAVDRAHGDLLQSTDAAIHGVVLECRTLPLDDDAASMLAADEGVSLLDPEHVLPILVAPIGLTASAALAAERIALGPIPVKAVCLVPALEAELVFDGGQPSARMIERFAQRRGVMHLEDGTSTEVRAVLEEDWQVSIQFGSDDPLCERIDRVRLGARAADRLDDRGDYWTTSLAGLGLDAQTRLVNQPIMIQMATGERFSL